MNKRLCVFSAIATLAAFCAMAADKNYEDEVASFGKIVDLWPEGKMPGPKTDKPELLDNGQPKGDINYQNVSHPTITIRKAPGGGIHPAMLICPGGGYFLLAWRHEGMEIAQWANDNGFDAFILKYRVPNDGSIALIDAQRAVSWMRANAKELGIDPDKIAQIGFSAGANLTARTANNFKTRKYEPVDAVDNESCRPDATILVYPGGLLKGGFRAKPTPDLALCEDTFVTEDTPPVFITQTEDDFCQVENSLAYYLACKKCKVPAAMLLGPKGGHGYGSRKTGRDNDAWPELAAVWLKRTFGAPRSAKVTPQQSGPVSGKFSIQGAKGRLSAILKLPDVFANGKKYPVAVLCHGFRASKDERGGMLKDIADRLAKDGIASVRFDFNGHGESEGLFTDMTVPNEIEDAKKVIAWAKSQPWAGKVSILGHSQGGVVAAMAAGELGDKEIDRVVLLAPACVLKEAAKDGWGRGPGFDPEHPPKTLKIWGSVEIGGEYVKTAYKLPIYETAKNFKGPALLLHGTGDGIAPDWASKRFHEIWEKSELHLLENDNHGLSVHFREVLDLISAFIAKSGEVVFE